MMAIERPKFNTVYISCEDGELYVYHDFNSNMNGHVLWGQGRTSKRLKYLWLSHSEFKEKYVKAGEL